MVPHRIQKSSACACLYFLSLRYAVPVRSFTLNHRHAALIKSRNLKRALPLWAGNQPPIVDDRGVALTSLEKLMDKQRSELAETEQLFKRISLQSNGFHNDTEHSEGPCMSSHDGAASSFLSGVDYGFESRSEGSKPRTYGGMPIDGESYKSPSFEDYGPPSNIFILAVDGFKRNLKSILGQEEDHKDLNERQIQLQAKLKNIKLNVTGIWEREHNMEKIPAPLIIKIPYYSICYMLDYLFEGRYIPARFYFLETVARVPYFAYIAMLHLYETLGWWRRSSDVKRIHFAEEWNEYNHLLIMESLGGDQKWWVRFLANHSAVFYYWTLLILWALSPTLAYQFSELLETHAVSTYSQLLDDNEELLKDLPPTFAAVEYYSLGATDPLFDEYQTTALAKGELPRRPGTNMKTLYDVFVAIRDDEGDHVATMKSCLDPTVAVKSPSVEKTVLAGVAFVAAFGYFMNTGDIADIDISNSIDALSGIAEGNLENVDGNNLMDVLLGGTAASVGNDILDVAENTDMADIIAEDGLAEAVVSLLRMLMDVIMRL